MVFLVPFDGSDLSAAALERATEFASFADGDVVVLSVVPDEREYATDRGWIDAHEEFTRDLVASRLEAQARSIDPDATFRWESLSTSPDPTSTVSTDVARTIREVAAEIGAEIVFIGSENAGRVSTPLTSVGSPVSTDPRYDVHIVRHPGE